MPESVTLKDYERAERSIAVKDARRGLLVHAAMAVFTVAVHYLIVRRWAQRSVERRQARIESAALEEMQAA